MIARALERPAKIAAAPGVRRTILFGEMAPSVRRDLEPVLRKESYEIVSVGQNAGLIPFLRKADHVSAVLIELSGTGALGCEFVSDIRRERPGLPVLTLSARSRPADVVRAIQAGAADFLPTPVHPQDLLDILERTIRDSELPGGPRVPRDGKVFYGASPAMEEIRELIPTLGGAEIPVLILGETGTGKEALARELHAASPRADKPFVKLNCAAVPSELVESELFGHEKGAFTGAIQRKQGLFELADQGTILLDEIGDMDFRLQAKLLQVLQDQEFRSVGGREPIRVNVRVIAATHQDLEKSIAENAFRADLFYRLNVCTLVVPPLRQRQQDIGRLAEFLIRKHGGPDLRLLTADLVEAMEQYGWPGNVRELENVVRKLVTLKDSRMIARELRSRTKARPGSVETRTADEIPHSVYRGSSVATLEEVTRATEKAEAEAIVDALESTRWNRKRAAARLGVDYKALLYRMKKLNISAGSAAEEGAAYAAIDIQAGRTASRTRLMDS